MLFTISLIAILRLTYLFNNVIEVIKEINIIVIPTKFLVMGSMKYVAPRDAIVRANKDMKVPIKEFVNLKEYFIFTIK